jgi:hypothetical protein
MQSGATKCSKDSNRLAPKEMTKDNNRPTLLYLPIRPHTIRQ